MDKNYVKGKWNAFELQPIDWHNHKTLGNGMHCTEKNLNPILANVTPKTLQGPGYWLGLETSNTLTKSNYFFSV